MSRRDGGAKSRLPLTLAIGLAIVGVWIMLAVLAPLIVPVDPDAIDLDNVLKPPGEHGLLGTDQAGRDILSRIIMGSRIGLWVSFAGVAVPMLIGSLAGLFSAYKGGFTDNVMMRLIDITLAFPFLILVLAIIAMLGPGISNFLIAVALVGWVSYARLIRAEVLVLKRTEFVQAAEVLGISGPAIAFRHILPNAIAPVLVYAMTDAVLIMLAGASIGFLGLGVQPPTAEWGDMIASGQAYLAVAWWISFFPGLALVTLGLGYSMIGDGLARMLNVSQQ